MTAYVNPPFGDDSTAKLESQARPYKTHKAAVDAMQAAAKGLGGSIVSKLVETHRKPPENDSVG